MAQLSPYAFYIRQIVASENLPKCHILPCNPDDTAVLEIGTKIATIGLGKFECRSEFHSRLTIFTPYSRRNSAT